MIGVNRSVGNGMLGHSEGVGKTTLLSASFTAANATLIRNYTPEIGPVCLQGVSVGANALPVAFAPDSYIEDNRMRRGANFRGPIWQLSTGTVAIQAKMEWAVVQNLSLITRLVTPTMNRGTRILVLSTALQIRSQSNSIIGDLTRTLNSGDIVRLEDSGLVEVGALKVYVNGVLALQNTLTTGLVATTGNQVSAYIANDQGYFDDLLITEL